MEKEKKKKENIYYQILDKNNNPVRLISHFEGHSIKNIKSGKVFLGRARAISHVRRFLSSVRTPSKYRVQSICWINTSVVEKDDLIKFIFSLKIQAFRPAEVEELTFHLEKLT